MVTKTDSILDFYKEKPKGLFDFLSEVFSSSGTTSYIYNSKAHFIISLYIKEQSGYAHFELICSDIPKNVASRGTIQSILDMGVKLGVYNKLAYPNDKRVKLYNLSKIASSEIDRFFKSFLDLSKNFNKKI